MSVAEDFIKGFHNLDGILLKEKKKSLYLLLKKNETKIGEPTILNEIVEKLVPSSYLEEVFRLEFLIFFRHSQELLNVLKTGNDIFKSKILKQSWFVQEILVNLTPNQFVSELLPTLSYSVRLKILKKLIKHLKDVEKIDGIYDVLHQTYGFDSALILLPACSVDKIKDILSENHVKLSLSYLKSLFRKDPELIVFYIKIYKDAGGDMQIFNWNPIVNEIALKRTDLFVKLAEDYDLTITRTGRRTTKLILNNEKETVLSKPTKYIELLRKDTLVRKLGNNFPIFFKNSFPENMEELRYSTANEILRYYPKKKQYQLFFDTFQSVYKKSLWDHVDYMEERLLALVPDKEERDKWVDKFEFPANFLQYYSVEKSVAMLEDALMSCPTVQERRNHLNSLIMTCKINEDYQTLLKILKNFCNRHRNNEAFVLSSFVETIYNNINLEKLNEQHWTCIHEIITVQQVKKQRVSSSILLKYMEFLHKSGKSFDSFVLTYMKAETDIDVSFKSLKSTSFQKKLLQDMVDSIHQVKDEDVAKELAPQIVVSVKKWNRKYPKEYISVHSQPAFLKLIEKAVDIEWLYYKFKGVEALNYIICTQKEGKPADVLENIYWKRFQTLGNISVTKWYLKYRPSFFKTQFGCLKKLVEMNHQQYLLNYIKKYSHINLPQLAVEFYEDRLKDPEIEDAQTCFVILALLMSSQEYIDFQKKYHPTCDKLDLLSIPEETRQLYNLQCAASRAIRYVQKSHLALSDIFEYCRGDYLGTVLPSLYSCSDRTVQDKVPFIVDELSKRAVSVKKHAMFLTCRVLPTENVLKQFLQTRDTETNKSIQKHLFSSCYKYFLRNGTDDLWVLLQQFMKGLSKTDFSAFKILTKVDNFPRHFRADYIQLVWEIFLKNEADGGKMKGYISDLFNEITNEDIDILPVEFCLKMMETKLFEECTVDENVQKFATKFLLYGKSTDDNVKFTLEMLSNLKKKYWQSEKDYKEVRQLIYQFCRSIYDEFMQIGKKNKKYSPELPQSLSTRWREFFTVTETFEEHLMIDFIMFKHESKDNMAIYANKICAVFDKYRQSLGDLILNPFKKFLYASLKFLITDEKLYDHQLTLLLRHLLEQNSSDVHCLMVIYLLPQRNKEEKTRKLYDEMLEMFHKKQGAVEIALNAHFKNA